MQQSLSWICDKSLRCWKHSPPFIETSSQKPATEFYPKTVESSPYSTIPRSIL